MKLYEMEASRLIAKTLALTTLHTPNDEDARMFVTIYLDALEAHREVNRAEVIEILSQTDPRFLEDIIEGRIEYGTDTFNPNGYLYVGREICREVLENGYIGELIIKRGRPTKI